MKCHKLAIIIAMESEAKPIIEALNCDVLYNTVDGELPFKVCLAVYHGVEITIIISGKDNKTQVDNVATQPAVLMAYIAIKEFQPDIIINAGTAGGFKSRGSAIGTVYIGTTIVFHDRRIPIPGFDEYGIGNYPGFYIDALIAEVDVVPGIISTGNSLDLSSDDQEIMIKMNADVKDMEAAAIAWVCSLYKIPILVLKAITDLVDNEKPTHEEFLANLEHSSSILCKKVIKTVDYMIEHG